MTNSLESNRPILASVSSTFRPARRRFKRATPIPERLPARSFLSANNLSSFLPLSHNNTSAFSSPVATSTTINPNPSNTSPTPTMSSPPSHKKQQSTGNRASTRMSTYSATPTLTPSIAPSHLSAASSTAGDPKAQEIKSWNAGFERLEDKRLVQQRYALSTDRADDMSKLALGAKLDRALGRRMSGQDAVFRPKVLSEKKVQA